MKKIIISFLIVLALIVVVIVLPEGDSLDKSNFNNIDKNALDTSDEPNWKFKILVENLEIPWDVAFIDDSRMLLTEREGVLSIIDSGGNKKIILNESVKTNGEGGMLGLVLHPDFKKNGFLYLYLTKTTSTKDTINRVERYKFANDLLQEKKIIIDNIPGATYHDGGRMEFGPDGKLYVTTGDATKENIAQDLKSLGGKILRLNDDGSIPPNNPFGTAVYSYGHRNPQGIAWDSKGRLWSTEHGRSGVLSGLDEINMIIKGGNYGWPVIEGDNQKEKMTTPLLHSGASDTWAPASAVVVGDKLYFGGLRGQSLYVADISTGKPTNLKEYFHEQFGRIRTVRFAPDGNIYLTTSNKDGRGIVKDGDDKIIKINISALE